MEPFQSSDIRRQRHLAADLMMMTMMMGHVERLCKSS